MPLPTFDLTAAKHGVRLGGVRLLQITKRFVGRAPIEVRRPMPCLGPDSLALRELIKVIDGLTFVAHSSGWGRKAD